MAGTSKKTLKSIADQLGFSVTTISRVLAGKARKYRISKNTEAKVLAVAENANFTPNQLARSLRLRKTNIIGVVIPDISNPFFSTIAQNIEFEARKLGYAIILCDSEENTAMEIASIELLKNRDVDGLIISPVGQESKHLKNLWEEGLPLVIVDRCFPNLKIPYVACDNYRGAYEAVSYLIRCGHRKIACIQGMLQTFPNEKRVRGYKEALQAHNIKVKKSFIVGDSFGAANGYLSMKLLLKQLSIPTAIFALSNLISLGALQAIREENLQIPKDISIISFDEQPYSEYLSPPMTTIKQQNAKMGQISVKLLIDQIASNALITKTGILLPTKLIKRASVRIIQN